MDTNLKKKIKTWCKIKGKKPYHLGRLAGVPFTSIYRYLRGGDLKLSTAEKIEKVINRDFGI